MSEEELPASSTASETSETYRLRPISYTIKIQSVIKEHWFAGALMIRVTMRHTRHLSRVCKLAPFLPKKHAQMSI